jgi:hypothetical protein
MFDRNQLETFLRINGMSPFNKNEEIKSLLLSARWNEEDVDTALMVLKQNKINKETTVDTVHKVFRSNERLSPQEIQSLLGIEVDYSDTVAVSYAEEQIAMERKSTRIAMILALLIAAASVTYVMYQERAGFFYTSANSPDIYETPSLD